MKRRNDLPVLAKKLSVAYKVQVRLLGPYITKKNGRRILDVRVDSDPTSSLAKTIQLARARLEVKLGRPLNAGETVDHVDNDCTNDRYSNVQLLSRAENAAKQTLEARANSAEACRRPEVRKKNSISKQGEKNHQAKVTNSQAKEIRNLYRKGELDLLDIKRDYGFLSIKSVKDLLAGNTYLRAKGPKSVIEAAPVGRPSRLSEDHKKRIKRLAATSELSLADIASILGISKYAVYRFMKGERG